MSNEVQAIVATLTRRHMVRPASWDAKKTITEYFDPHYQGPFSVELAGPGPAPP